ncbi:MAG: hypothetical protein R2769_12135 [Saprospiraceae bacterium]
MVEIEPGKTISIKYLNMTEPNDQGVRLVFFRLNGQTRSVQIKDEKASTNIVVHQKASDQTK